MGTAAVHVLADGDGVAAAANAIRRRAIQLSSTKVLVLVAGRSDLPVTPEEFTLILQDFQDTVDRFNPATKIVFVAPIPRATDDRKAVAKCINMGKIVRKYAASNENTDFSRVAQEFYNKSGVNVLMLSEDGATTFALAAIKFNIIAKLTTSTKLA